MKKVAIVGLGWLGMPLALSLTAKNFQVTGTKTTSDGVEAARMCGIDSYLLQLTPQLMCDSDSLETLLDVDALVITLPVRRSRVGEDKHFYPHAVQELVDSALAHNISRIIFTSSTSVYGDHDGVVTEQSLCQPVAENGLILQSLEQWLHDLPGTSVDILRLAGLIGPERHPGRFLAGKEGVANGHHGVNLVHLEDVISAITLLLMQPRGGHLYNLCAPGHPDREVYYPQMARKLNLAVPQFCPQESAKQGKIVDGSSICRDLGFIYQYPDPLTMPVS